MTHILKNESPIASANTKTSKSFQKSLLTSSNVGTESPYKPEAQSKKKLNLMYGISFYFPFLIKQLFSIKFPLFTIFFLSIIVFIFSGKPFFWKKFLRMDHMHEQLQTKFNYFSEDSRSTNFHFQKFCMAELACALFSTIGIALAILAVIHLFFWSIFFIKLSMMLASWLMADLLTLGLWLMFLRVMKLRNYFCGLLLAAPSCYVN